jgi:hypothetical protein
VKIIKCELMKRIDIQLEGLNLIKIGVKVSGSDFRMINITKEGLEESSKNQAQA